MRAFVERWKNLTDQIMGAEALSVIQQRTAMVLIVVVILVVRMATINKPDIKWTAWKEIDYIYLSQNFWQDGFNFVRPEISWPAEPPRVTEMELPVVPYTAGIFYAFFGYNVYSVRAVTLLASILLIIYLFKLTKRELGPVLGVGAALAAGVLPLYHPFNRMLFTEPLMIAMSVVAIYYLAEWVDTPSRRNWVLAILSLSLTFALKLESLYLLLPIGWIAFRKFRFDYPRYKSILALILITSILPIAWYVYAYFLEMSGAHLFGIFTGHNKSQTLAMLTNLGWYRAMAGRVINGIFGGFYGTLLFLFGLAAAVWLRKGGVFFAYLIAVGIYFGLVAEGQIDAPYRQMTIIPPASAFLAVGTLALATGTITIFNSIARKRQILTGTAPMVLLGSLVLIVLIPLMEFRAVLGFEGPAHWERWTAAEEIKNYTDSNSKLVMTGEYSKHVGGYDLSPVLYYYTGTQGWTLTPEKWDVEYVDQLREKGATLFVAMPPYNDPGAVNYQPEQSVDPFIESLKSEYPVLLEEQGLVILDLRRH